MGFNPKNLSPTFEPCRGGGGLTRHRVYVRHQPKWYLPFACRHGATIPEHEEHLAHPGDNRLLNWMEWKDTKEMLLLLSSRCLICNQLVIEGVLRQPDGTERNVGVLYAFKSEKTQPYKDVPDEQLLEYHHREWEFITTLLADFNKLTIAVAIAASVFFEKYPYVFFTFIGTCFVLIALYFCLYMGQKSISRQHYRAAGKKISQPYKSKFDDASKFLQWAFGVAVIVVLCFMIRAEKHQMSEKVEKTRPWNPVTVQLTPKTLPSPPPLSPPPPKKKD